MSKSLPVEIQSGVKFSKSLLWGAQREYYDSLGVEAWSDQVPFYVTSNPLIADQYARLLLRFFQDWTSQNPSDDGCFYILELGTGCGQFSFYLLKRMRELQQQWGLSAINYCYVMSDFTQNNLSFWRSHPGLQSFLESGELDFAVFDLESDKAITLQQSGTVLTKGDFTRPLSVIANYLFDSVVADVFRVQDGAIYESLVNLSIEKRHYDPKEMDWSKVELGFERQQVEDNHYGEPELDRLLAYYQSHLSDAYLTYPIGSLRGLLNLADLASGRLFLLSSDKGYVELAELEEAAKPELAFHGSFSMMVNYHAIAKFFKNQQGDAYLQELFDAFATGVFTLGCSLAELPRTREVVQDTVGGFCPGHFYHIYDGFDQVVKSASIEMIASMLAMSHWDPAIFELASDRLSEIVDDADVDVVQYLARHMPDIAANFYFIPESTDVLFSIGVFFQEIEEFDQAEIYYAQSERFYGDNFELSFNMGYCLFEQDKLAEAKAYFARAHAFQPTSQEVSGYLKKLKMVP